MFLVSPDSRWMLEYIHPFIPFFQDGFCVNRGVWVQSLNWVSAFPAVPAQHTPRLDTILLQYLGEDHLFLMGQITARISCSWGETARPVAQFCSNTISVGTPPRAQCACCSRKLNSFSYTLIFFGVSFCSSVVFMWSFPEAACKNRN